MTNTCSNIPPNNINTTCPVEGGAVKSVTVKSVDDAALEHLIANKPPVNLTINQIQWMHQHTKLTENGRHEVYQVMRLWNAVLRTYNPIFVKTQTVR